MPKDTSKPRKGMLGSNVIRTSRPVSKPRVARLLTKALPTNALASAGVDIRKGIKLNPGARSDGCTSNHSDKENTTADMNNKSDSETCVLPFNMHTTLETLESDTMGASWHKVLSPEFEKPYFKELKEFLEKEQKAYTIYPEMHNIYSWSRFTPLDEVKVVILGQDPYHDVGQAHGLSFSVLPPTKPPGSLKNIYKQIHSDFPSISIPLSGDLTPVAKLGVLWLNTSLTVRAHTAGSHAKKGWETFTAQVIRSVLQRPRAKHPGVVVLAWGLHAQKTIANIGIDKEKHLLLESAHPSGLSAHRGFIGNNHFRLANEWLIEKYGEGSGIDWAVLNQKKSRLFTDS